MASRVTWIIAACFVPCVAFAQAGAIVAPSLTDAEKKKLDLNEVVVKEFTPTDNRGVSGQAMGVVDAPSAEVWPVVRDCEHFSKFLPSTKASAKKEENGESLCFDEIALPFPLMNLWADTRSVMTEEPAGHFRREWSFVRGTYKRNKGSWTVVPWGADGKKSLVVYFVDSDPSMLVPDFILRSAQVGTLPKIFVGVRQRVEALRATAKAAPAPAPAPAAAQAAAVPAPAPVPAEAAATQTTTAR